MDYFDWFVLGALSGGLFMLPSVIFGLMAARRAAKKNRESGTPKPMRPRRTPEELDAFVEHLRRHP